MTGAADSGRYAPIPGDSQFARNALSLAAKGMHVFPCESDKSPFTANGHKDATVDPETIRGWGESWPDAAVGIACEASGIVVIDIDDEDAWRRFLLEKGIDVPSAPTVETPSGGTHLYFRAREGARYPSRLCGGVDVKHNGYVLAPPSVAFSKRPGRSGSYQWKAGTRGLTEAPGWLEDLVKTPRSTATRSDTPIHLGEVEELLTYIDPDADYDTWCKVLMGVHAAGEGSAEAMENADLWSSRGTKYKAGEVARKWKSFKADGGAGMGTIAKLAEQAGANLAAISRKWKTAVLVADTGDSEWFEALDLSSVVASWTCRGLMPLL